MTLPGHLQAAVDAYTGPVTVCPPSTFTEGLYFENGKPFYTNRGLSNGQKAQRALGDATRTHIKAIMDGGKTATEAAKEMGMSYGAVCNHIRRMKAEGVME